MALAPRQGPATTREQGVTLLGSSPLLTLAGVALVVACLSWGQAFLMPVAVAVLLTYLLSPLVALLERRRVPPVVAVVGVVTLTFAALGGLAWVVLLQLSALGAELPKYGDNIRQKVADLRLLGRDSTLERMQETVERAVGEAERQVERARPPAGRAEQPTPVIVQEDRPFWSLPGAAGAWLDPLGRAGFVAVLVPFMLLGRQELRNRTIRLFGFGRLALTTRALDEANARVSRYLLNQTGINAAFGALAAGGLFLLGVPYALLLGLLAGALRFIPYVGPWIGAVLPVLVSLAVFPGWTRPLLLVAFWVALELFTNLVLEVVFWARSAGVSQVGLLLAVGFWTWVWGSIGLVVATPLTVCLLVFARHVPALEFLWVVMGDQPVVSPDVLLYQRLLAMDEDEASDLVERALAGGEPREKVWDGVVLPALGRAAHDHARGRISDGELRVVVDGVREIVESVAEPGVVGQPSEHRVLAAPARAEADRVALLMLRDLLTPARVALEVASADLLSAEIAEWAQRQAADVVVIGALPPGGVAQARYLSKRLRAVVPAARLVVGRWCVVEDVEAMRQALQAAGADAVGTTLAETRELLLQRLRLQPETAQPAA